MLMINAKTSAKTTASHIPFRFQIRGSMNIIAIWKIKVLKNEMAAETTPLFNAVKNDDAKMLIPLIK